MLDFLKIPLNWLVKQHPAWIAFPYCVLAALGAFPSVWGVGCSFAAACLFMLCLTGWRLNAR